MILTATKTDHPVFLVVAVAGLALEDPGRELQTSAKDCPLKQA